MAAPSVQAHRRRSRLARRAASPSRRPRAISSRVSAARAAARSPARCSRRRRSTRTAPSSPRSHRSRLALQKTSLRFAAVTAGGAFLSQTAAQVVALTQNGPGTVTWTATPSQPWLQVSPASGTGPADLSVSVVAAAGLPASGTRERIDHVHRSPARRTTLARSPSRWSSRRRPTIRSARSIRRRTIKAG